MLSIKHNLLAQNADRQLNINNKKKSKITEKLTSGYRINRAADDAAGLAISEKMRRQIRGLHQASENVNDGISYVKTAEGALQEVQEMLQRINQLAVQAANGTNTVADRAAINSEIQALKAEMNRVFSTTTFNEQRIWTPIPEDDRITYREEDAVTYTNPSTNLSEGVTNANCGVLAVSGEYYNVHADNGGVWIDWTGYDGNTYQTQRASWDDIENNGYSFNMEDYFGIPDQNNKLYYYDNTAGEYRPVFAKTVSFTPHPLASRRQIIDSINNSKMSASASAFMSVNSGASQLVTNTPGVEIREVSLTYEAAYLSWARRPGSDGHDFDAADNDFIKPNPPHNLVLNSPLITDVDTAERSNEKWTFTFDMEGIGTVTATSATTIFHSNDKAHYDSEDEGKWWGYYIDPYDGLRKKGVYSDRGSGGTLGDVMRGLRGNGNARPWGHYGLLSKGSGGFSDRGGYIDLRFNITPDDTTLTYGGGEQLRKIGGFTLRIQVYANDTSQGVLNRINSALNENSILDFQTNDARSDSAKIGGLRGTPVQVQIPVYPDDYVPYDDTQNLYIQAGAEAGQHIGIEYEFLSVEKLGMTGTNTLTVEDASNAINEVKAALQKVSEQRSLFGAYQNRLEHTYNVNKNTEENTQASESLIRDTDVADMMMEFSINNILMQAGVSMLTQANQQGQIAMRLLQ